MNEEEEKIKENWKNVSGQQGRGAGGDAFE